MTNAPERIWAWESLVGDAQIPENLWSIKSTPFSSLGDRATGYIREDIVDDLADALEDVLDGLGFLSGGDHELEGYVPEERWAPIRAALTKYREGK